MKKIIFSLSFFLLCTLSLIAQQNHFIYIQADNKQPFYIKLNDKIYSSSSSGYIILSKLIEADYNLTIGFPKNEWPEQKLNLTVQKTDLGYLLKNFEDKGWGLVDMNTFQILYNNTLANVTKPSSPIVKGNEVKEKPVEVKKEEPKPVEIKVQEKSIVKAEKAKEKSTEIQKEEPKPSIAKLFTSKSNSSIEMIYLVKNNTTLDTVRVSIPIDELKTQITPEEQPFKIAETKINKEVVQTPATKPIEKPVEEQTKQAVSTNIAKETNVVKSTPKNNCTSVANEDDYKKLRKKMASAESDNEMIYKATSTFQKLCYTTEQIKTLSFLFLNDEGKYKFLDAAYPFVTDVQNFSKLVSLLSDEYFIKRFNTMLKN
jgi:hypothetical protein